MCETYSRNNFALLYHTVITRPCSCRNRKSSACAEI